MRIDLAAVATLERRGREGRREVLSFFASFALIVVAAPGLAASPSQTPSPPAQASAASGNVENGKTLYVKYSCYACHGYEGHGTGPATRLVPMRMNLPGFSAYLKNPRQMPPYTSKVLSDEQAADIWAYIKSIPESPPARAIPLLSQIISGK
jgi:mono/diheme cytochrome c family protein